MTSYQGRRVFRASRGYTLFIAACAALPLLGAVMTYRDRGWHWLPLSLAAMTLLGMGGVIEAVVSRVVLEEETLYVRELLPGRRYARREIARVDWAKGVPTTLTLVDGRRVRLPNVGHDMANSIRAWLRAGG